ncbi:jacalin-related lectin 3-like [Tasmannia lanceolata]|uniref:jacalin-related lectin 3-like n=1 Tax=Tasmannia lanceolata TaxID=3420 RepID=UPI004063D559
MDYKENGKNPISVGPWGGQGGSPWDDGVYTTVRQLVVSHASAIDSLQIEYDRKGSSVWSEKHGGIGGTKTDKIKLDLPDEVLTSISGHYGSIFNGSPAVIRSLTFETNRSTYGPFGIQQGAHFSFPMRGGKIVGFHGRSGWYLDSIGVYLKPLQNLNPSNTLIPKQNFAVNGTTDKIGYNIVQGTVGKGYDIVVAIREKDDKKVLLNSISRQSSKEFSEGEPKNMVVNYPSYTEKFPSNNGGPVTYGPWGGNGGTVFDDGVYTGVRQINLTRNVGITSIKIQYDKNGQAIWGNKHGGSGGIRSEKIAFDYPFEVLTHITGYYGTTLMMGPTAIKSLTFHTTKRKYGPFGDEQGIFFSSAMGEGMIVGFHGRKGWYIDGIGVHVLEGKLSLPTPATNPSGTMTNTTISEVDNPQWSNKLVLANKRDMGEEVAYGVVKEPVPCGPGPWGGNGGRPWDDGVFNGVKQIFLTRGEAMTSIQIEYDRNGQSVWSTRHGGGGGDNTHKIKFEYPNEVLNCICGYYSSINRDEGPKFIRSLTFYTSRGKYGPFGEEIGSFFTSTTTEGKVVGFHGRSGLYLDAIGVHMQHWLGERRTAKSMISKFFN